MVDIQGDFTVGDWQASPMLGQLASLDETRRLQPKAMNVLVYLADRVNEVATREQILESVWGPSAVSDEPLTRCIAELRRSFDDKPSQPKYIETIPKRGYRLIAEISYTDKNEQPAAPRELAGVDDNSVAVMPFRDLSPAGDQNYFAEGIAEEIATALASRRSLKVAAHASTSRLAGEDLASIREKIRVRYVVSGSVRKYEDNVRVTIGMADTLDGYEIWTRSFDRKLKDIFSIQSEIANSVVESLPARGVAAPWAATETLTSEQLAANDLYLQGLREMRQRTRSSIYSAVEKFVMAFKRDPGCAKALAAEAMAYALMPWFGLATDNKVSYTHAVAKAKQALSINPELPDAYVALGMGLAFQYEWQEGEKAFLRAQELSPSHADAHQHYGTLLGLNGQADAALDQCHKAERVDPLSPSNGLKIGVLEFAMGEVEAGLQRLEKIAESNEEFVTVWTFLSRMYLDLAMYDKAIEAMSHDVFMAGFTIDVLRQIAESIRNYRDSGVVSSLPEEVELKISQPAVVARYFAMVGDFPRAIKWQQRACETYDPFGLWLNIDPALDGIRELPEYSGLMKIVGFS